MNTERSEETQQSRILQDIFDFGLLMLRCAVGEPDIIGMSEFLNKLKIFLAKYYRKPEEQSNYCCVIHNEEDISSFDSSGKNNKKNDHAQVTIKDLLVYSGVSPDFLDFLCCCLKFNPSQRWTADSLLRSKFVTKLDTIGPQTTLKDIIKVSNPSTKDALPTEYQAASEKRLEKVCDALSLLWSQCNSTPDQKEKKDRKRLEQLEQDGPSIQELALDLGLSVEKVQKNLKRLVKEIHE